MVIESLEQRLAPAGLVMVTVSGGVLTLTGDALDNAVTVTQIGEGEFRITGQSDTLIQIKGQAAAASLDVANAGKGLMLNLLGGNDDVALEGVTLTGGLTANMGAGNNGLAITQATSIGGNFSYTGGAGTDGVIIDGDLTVGGSMVLNLGHGDNSVGVLEDTLSVGQGLTIHGGSGGDLLMLAAEESTEVGGSVLLNLGTGNNTAEISSARIEIAGNLTVLSGAGDPGNPSGLRVYGDEVRIGGNVSISYGAGANVIHLLADEVLTVGGKLSVATTGLQSPTVVLLAAPVISIGGDLSIASGSGQTLLEVAGPDGRTDVGLLTVGGDFKVSYGGNDGLESTETRIGIAEIRVGGQVSITAVNGYYKHAVSAKVLQVAEDITVTTGNATGIPASPNVSSTAIHADQMVAAGIRITHGTGNFSTTLGSLSGQIQRDVIIRNGGRTLSTTTSVIGSFDIGGNLQILNGLGGHATLLQTEGVMRVGGSLTVDHASGGPDAASTLFAMTGQRFEVGNDFTLRYGHGMAETVVAVTDLIVADDLSILHGNSTVGGRNVDAVNAAVLRVGGDLTLRGGVGEFGHSINGGLVTIQGAVTVTHGRHVTGVGGFNELQMGGTRVAIHGPFLSNNAGGEGGMAITLGAEDLTLARGLVATHGAGADGLTINATTLNVGGDIVMRAGHGDMGVGIAATSGGTFDLKGSVIVLAGAGSDDLAISGRGQIRGSVTASLGAGDHVSVRVSDVTLGGAVNIGASAAAPVTFVLENVKMGGNFVFRGGHANNALTINQSDFAGTVGIFGGAGVDSLEFGANNVRGAFTVAMGAGADAVVFTGAGSGSGTGSGSGGYFQGPVKVLMEGGDDIVVIENTPRIFFKSVILDGGAGTDALGADLADPGAPLFLAGPPTVVNFEPQGNA